MALWNKKVGLALGGGAVKGFAHIGVLDVFEKNKIKVSAISGTSAGAIVAAFYAFGKAPDEIFSSLQKLNWKKVSSLTLSKGIFTNNDLKNFIEKELGKKNIEDAKIPLAIVCTDIATGEKVVLNKGPVAEAIQASSAIPGIFAPVHLDNKDLVDGAICENVPVSPLNKMGAELIIGVNLNEIGHYPKPDSIFDIISNGFDMVINTLTEVQLKDADHVIQFHFDDNVRTDVSKAAEIFHRGREEAYESVQRVKHLIRWPLYNEFWFLVSTIKQFLTVLVQRLLYLAKKKI